jgi:uncharacterized protein
MIEVVKEKVQKHMLHDNCGHGFDHIERVYGIALKLLATEEANREVVVLASLLHDVDDYKLFGQEAADNLTNAKRIMTESNIDFDVQHKVCDIIYNMGYSKSLAGIRPKTIEGKIVSDADMLDALGVNGIVRTLSYAFSRCQKYGTPVFDKNVWPEINLTADEYKMMGRKADNCINHFFEKTLRLGKMMMTEAGKEQSKIRLRRMIDFLYGYFDENNVPEWTNYLNSYLKNENIEI